MSVIYANTPGVKIVENSLLAPSIVQVSTAIPVFLGYTENGTVREAVRITSLKEFEDTFGGENSTGVYKHTFGLTADANNVLSVTTSPAKKDFIFYECIQMYFLNGGGPCYILPVGSHTTATAIAKLDFTKALDIVDTLDEPTLIAFPEAVALTNVEYTDIVKESLTVCNNTKDKFTLIDQANTFDLSDRNPIATATNGLEAFRTSLGTDYLSYGAVYYPNLSVSLNFTIDESTTNLVTTATATAASTTATLKALKDAGDANYNKAITLIQSENNMKLPPSALMAGVYAKNDREKGFWQAPANVSLQGVIKPVTAISSADQEGLNVDATSGKSINALREFTGKGTLVWGARTLDGNSNEWRYISVRRLFMTVEESIKKATDQFVFENNDSKTWVKVSSMISSYLNDLWKQGALMGASPEEAYFVEVGVGTTMTTQDVLEGRMIVQVGLAAVRPAEFIILEFSHFIGE